MIILFFRVIDFFLIWVHFIFNVIITLFSLPNLLFSLLFLVFLQWFFILWDFLAILLIFLLYRPILGHFFMRGSKCPNCWTLMIKGWKIPFLIGGNTSIEIVDTRYWLVYIPFEKLSTYSLLMPYRVSCMSEYLIYHA